MKCKSNKAYREELCISTHINQVCFELVLLSIVYETKITKEGEVAYCILSCAWPPVK